MSNTENRYATEIERDNGVAKVGFIDDDKTYHVFHDFSIHRSKFLADTQTLEIEIGKNIVVIKGNELANVNKLLHRMELFQIATTPEAEIKVKDMKQKGIAYATSIIVGVLEEEEDYEEEEGY